MRKHSRARVKRRRRREEEVEEVEEGVGPGRR